MKAGAIYSVIAFTGFAVFPLVISNDYYLHLMILALMWVVIGSAWNILAGYTGQVSFGDAAFFGTGAYTAGLLVHHLGWSAWWGIPLGGVTATILAFPFGWICFRLRGAYFALVTLALNEIMRHIGTIWESLTEGMAGIMILQTFYAPVESPFGTLSSKTPYYYIILIIAAISIASVFIVMRSRLGYYFISIRENEDAAESLGIDTHFFKMISLCVAASLTGVAGGFYMNYMGFIDPETVFSLHDISIMAILVGIVGGVGTIYGPAVGAFIMVVAQELFRSGGFGLISSLAQSSGSKLVISISGHITEAHTLGFGILVILVIRFMPNGVVGDWHRLTNYISQKRSRQISEV
ncbi:Branched-chain amino acid transport system permease protein LivM (TC 3.A.1.4.1) [hydrothermal vent metagenome]|uniref:Branched-chain amino acid transport system permease protein LivM (TC 3.A.1.4.1) n=1 Tax=hydrothermal vent metagenome TaxID=652676 RepID=A0A3B1CEJ0_9ZZZZ